jgi:hypothetical protein
MPQLTQLPNGMVQITDDTGTTYDVPAEIAQQDYPEEFAPAQPQLDPGATSMAPMPAQPMMAPEPPPWTQQPQQFADEQMQFAPMEIDAPEPEMDFAPEEGMQIPSRSERQAVSVSQSGTGPYRESPNAMFPAPPDKSDVAGTMEVAYAQRMGAIDSARTATEQHQVDLAGRYGDLAAHREQTAQRQAAIHEEAMKEVQAGEAQLMERMNNLQRMDMNKVWKDTPQAAKLTGILSAGIAGWLNPTGENSVVQQMMKIADQSAREQAENMAQERFKIGAQERALGRMETRAEHGRKVYLEERALLESSVLNAIELEKSKYSSAITLSNLEQQSAAAAEQLAKTVSQLRDVSFEQAFKSASKAADIQESKANRRQRAAQFRQSIALQRANAEAKRKAAAENDSKGKALFVRDDGVVVYANPELAISPKEKEKFDDDVLVSRSLAGSAKKLMALVHKHGRAWKYLEPDERAALEQEIGNIIEEMRPKVGANLTEMEKKNLEKQFGDPLTLLKSPAVTEKLLNRAVDNLNERIDTRMRQWGAHTVKEGEVPGLGKVQYSDRYKAGELSEYFGQEFEALNFGQVMESEAEASLQEITGLRNQLEETEGAAARANIEEQIVQSAAGLMSFARDQGLNEEQNKALFGAIDKATDGIDPTRFKVAAFARQGLKGYRPTEGSDVAGEFSAMSSEELSGKRLAEVLQRERDQYGTFGAMGRAEKGQGPLTKEEYETAAKWIEKD